MQYGAECSMTNSQAYYADPRRNMRASGVSRLECGHPWEPPNSTPAEINTVHSLILSQNVPQIPMLSKVVFTLCLLRLTLNDQT